MTEFIGTTLSGYRLEKQIGVGGMARLYYGRNYTTHQEAAIKIAHSNFLDDPAFRQRFQQEAETVKQLSHPAIIQLRVAAEIPPSNDNGRSIPYMITEYAAGGNLALYLLQNGRLSPIQSVRLLLRLTNALEHAHQQGIIHLDIKPENILLRQRGDLSTVAISDFGIAQLLDNATISATRLLLGTPSYMSPEQLEGTALNHRSDIYTLGVLLFQLVTGSLPFSATSPVQIFKQQQASLPTLTSYLGQTSNIEKLEDIIKVALAFEPAKRFETVADLDNALRQWLHIIQEPIPDLHQPQSVSLQTAVTKLLDKTAVAPTLSTDLFDFHRRWIGGQYRFFIGHQSGRIDILTFRDDQTIICIGRRAPQNDNGTEPLCDPSAFIKLDDPHVSTHHATIERAGNGWQIIDNSSTNGTFLDSDTPLEKHVEAFWQGQRPLRIGPYILAWQSFTTFGLSNQDAQQAYRKDEDDWIRHSQKDRFWLRPAQEELLNVTLMPPTLLTVTPGESADLQISLLNREAVVERVQVRLEGIPDSWYTIPIGDYALLAGNAWPFAIAIHPPALGEAVAGRYNCTLIIYSIVDGRERFKTPYIIEVAPATGLSVDLYPQLLHQGGFTVVSLWNTGNQPATYLLQARDPAQDLEFSEAERTVLVPPGERQQAVFEVTPVAKRPILPPGKALPFEINVGADETAMQTLNGRVELAPRLPGWLLIVGPLLIIGLILLVPILYTRWATERQIEQTAQAQIANAQATQIAAKATINVGEAMLASIDSESEEGLPSEETEAVATAVSQAQTDLDSAEAAEEQAMAAQATAKAIRPIGGGLPPNVPPTDVQLDKTELAEDVPSGTVVGVLTAVDASESDNHLFTLVSGEGDSDNGLFSITGSQLILNGSLDFEMTPELSIRVQASDQLGETFAKRLLLTVTDANEPPKAISLDQSMVEENATGVVIGKLTAVDDDASDLSTFSLIEDPSQQLELNGDTLRVSGAGLDFETMGPMFDVTVTAVDGGDNVFTDTVTIDILDQNDPPTVLEFGVEYGADENNPAGFSAALFQANFTDQDEDDLTSIKITQLPTAGLLKIGEVFVFEGQNIPIGTVNSLSYEPTPNFSGKATMRWNGYDGSSFALMDTPITIVVPPSSQPFSFVPETGQYRVDEDSGPHNFNWASSIRNPSGDPTDLAFVLCNNSNPELFSSQPRVNSGSGNLSFTPAEHANGTAVIHFILVLAEAEVPCANSEGQVPITIEVKPINDTPVLDCRTKPSTIVNEDAFTAVTVASILINARASAGENCIEDEDNENAPSAVALVGATEGAWEYALASGFEPVPDDVSDFSALLLGPDSKLNIRPGFNGTATLTFRAWDQSVGQVGSQNVNTTLYGDDSPFSEMSFSVQVVVTAVNNPPTITILETIVDGCIQNTPYLIAATGEIDDPDALQNDTFNLDGATLKISQAVNNDLDPQTIDISSMGGVFVTGTTIQYLAENVATIETQIKGELEVKFTTEASL